MRLIDLIKENFSISSENMELLSDIADTVQNDDFEIAINEKAEDSVSTFLGTAKIQRKTTMASGIEVLGFDNLIETLSKLEPEHQIGVAVLQGKSWAGRLHFQKDVSSKRFIAIVLVKRRIKKPPVIPQNWNGSKLEGQNKRWLRRNLAAAFTFWKKPT